MDIKAGVGRAGAQSDGEAGCAMSMESRVRIFLRDVFTILDEVRRLLGLNKCLMAFQVKRRKDQHVWSKVSFFFHNSMQVHNGTATETSIQAFYVFTR